MTTIEELNKKMWYRFLKVFVTIVIIVFSIISIYINFNNIGSYQTDYKVTCNYGNRTSFLAYKDKDIYISKYVDYTYDLTEMPNNINKDLRDACSISDKDISQLVEYFESNSNNFKPLFELTETKINEISYRTAIFWSIISIIIIFITVEIIKRCFYYIVLGSIKPKM